MVTLRPSLRAEGDLRHEVPAFEDVACGLINDRGPVLYRIQIMQKALENTAGRRYSFVSNNCVTHVLETLKPLLYDQSVRGGAAETAAGACRGSDGDE